MQMTWTGAPTIYYGDEAGLCGFTDPDNRRTYPWGREDMDLIAFHKEAIRIRKENPVLKTGSLMRLAADYNFLAYARFAGDEKMVVVLNNNNRSITKEISVWEAGVEDSMKMQRILLSYADGFTRDTFEYEVVNGRISIEMTPYTGLILKAIKERE